MNIDERLEKLTERHEALAQSIELSHHDIQQLGVYIRALGINAEADSKRIDSLWRGVEADSKRVDSLLRAVEADGENIRGLARIAEIHERRLTDIEGQ